jgi:PTS system mannose-specific IIA component
MIGILVVTHGRVAEELVNAARNIVEGLAAAAGEPVLILTDMFGGTPTNLSLPFLSENVEIVTGVSLPMLIKASALREGALVEVARAVREQGKGAIYVASEVLERRGA